MNADEVIEAPTHRLTLPQFLLSTVKVKVHIQALHKLCDGIFVGVRFLKRHDKNDITTSSWIYVHVSKLPKFNQEYLNKSKQSI